MICKVIDSSEYTYPDVYEYATARDFYDGNALRGSYAAFRIIAYNFDGDLRVATDIENCEFYEEIAIPVESNPGFDEGFHPHHPERIAPFSVYDCEKPYDGCITKKNDVTSIYVRIPANEDFRGNITLESEETQTIPVSVKVLGKPTEETLSILMGYSPSHTATYHNLDFRSEKFREIDMKYLKMIRSTHQNKFHINQPFRRKNENGDWEFKFDFFNRRAQMLFDLGFDQLYIHGVGFRRAWDAPDILAGDIDLLTYEGYIYLSQYLTALRENLKEKGWLYNNKFLIGVADEPNPVNATTYRAVTSIVRKYLPEIKIYDAVSYVPVYGAIDVWIPRADEYLKNADAFEQFRRDGDEIWHYVCLFPREHKYINRFMDLPLLATRYLFWANYKYNLKGYLHWSVNNYQGDLDPFKESCPNHVNAGSHSILPPGDDKLIYPGEDGPLMSARLEAHRESAEDYEMLKALSKHNKALADVICASVFTAFNNVCYDPVKFRAARDRLLIEYSKI